MAYNKHIVVVGSARSGTSWLAEVLARPHRYRLLFEPEHEFNTPKGHLLCDRWIASKEEAGPEAHRYLKKVFANRVDNDWIAQHSNRKWKRHLWPFIPKKYIIKFVRCNLSASYIANTFHIPVVHVVRDPFEVIASQQRVKFPWLYDLSRFQQQPNLVKALQEYFQIDITHLEAYSKVALLTLRWGIENCLPKVMHPLNLERYTWISHQQLREDISLFQKLCNAHQLEVAPNLETWYRKPSSKAHPRGMKGNAVDGERNALQSNEEVLSLLDKFQYKSLLKDVL